MGIKRWHPKGISWADGPFSKDEQVVSPLCQPEKSLGGGTLIKDVSREEGSTKHFWITQTQRTKCSKKNCIDGLFIFSPNMLEDNLWLFKAIAGGSHISSPILLNSDICFISKSHYIPCLQGSNKEVKIFGLKKRINIRIWWLKIRRGTTFLNV